MQILVTGVTGRIGRNLAARLLARGDQVRGLVLPGDADLEPARQQGIACVSAGLDDTTALVDAVSDVDAVVHLGAAMLWGDEHNAALFEHNVRGTFNLLEAARQNAKLQRFVLASSDEVYPSLLAQGTPIDENFSRTPWSSYGLSKLLCEEMAAFYQRAYGVPTTVARFALTIEPCEILRADRWLGKFLFLEPMIEVLKLTAGSEGARAAAALKTEGDQLLLARDAHGESYVFHHCDVRDLVGGLTLLLDVPAAVGETFNLGGLGPFGYDEAVPYLSERLGIPYVEARIPGPPIRIRQNIEKARTLLGYAPQYDIFRTIDSAVQQRP